MIEEGGEQLLFQEDGEDEASELLRLAIPLLKKHHIPVTPVNFSLFYNYLSGRDQRLNQKIDELLESESGWQESEAKSLFTRFVYCCDERIMDDLRHELLDLTRNMIDSMEYVTSESDVTSQRLGGYAEHISKADSLKDVTGIISSVISDIKTLTDDFGQLKGQLQASTTELNRLEIELMRAREVAYIDALTHIPNRRGFDRELQQLILLANKKHEMFSLIMCDVDHFKLVNDKFGHLVGDSVLRTMAQALGRYTKGRDIATRFGGEEFAILLPETGLSNAGQLAESLRKIIGRMILKRPSTGQSIGRITMSFGVAVYREGEEPNDFINRCDTALYEAKNTGRNRVVLAE